MSFLREHCKPIPCNDYRDFPVYKFSQGIPCNEYRIPAMRKGVPCNENRFFPVRISKQGRPCSGPVLALYRVALSEKNCLNLKECLKVKKVMQFP